MLGRHLWLGWLLAAMAYHAEPGPAAAEELRPGPSASRAIPYDQISKASREKIKNVLEHPTLRSAGPVETFLCKPEQYHDFLDHPDKAVEMWRKLGAKCITITDRGKGRYGWTDGKGSDISWITAFQDKNLRIWLAEGRIKPGTLLPTVPVRAVVVFHHTEGKDKKSRPLMRHQADLYILTDSTAAALAARLLGPSAPRLAENYVSQLQTFFAALAWYCQQHPDEVISQAANR